MAKPKRIEIQSDELHAIIDKACSTPLPLDDAENLHAAVDTLAIMTAELEKKRISIHRLRKILFGFKSEKRRKVKRTGQGKDDRGQDSGTNADKPQQDDDPVDASSQEHGNSSEEETNGGSEVQEQDEDEGEKKRRGHGRNGADAYTGAERVEVPYDGLEHGDPCPECPKGRVYRRRKPGVIVRIVGQAPLRATVYELEKLRCNLCGIIFTAKPPEDIGDEKYDASAVSVIAVVRYGCGMPFYRLEGFQEYAGIPLPVSTQWDLVESKYHILIVIFAVMVRYAAEGDLLHNDDTNMTILELLDKRAQAEELNANGASKRKGVFTTGILSVKQKRKIALFFTGNKHAGENLDEVLEKRAKELPAPIQMSDALSRNRPKNAETISANCNIHARRNFVDVAHSFSEEVDRILEVFGELYKNDAETRKQNMSAQQRLEYHQAHSGPLMDDFHDWLENKLEDKKIEPNSGLGGAIKYMLKHWKKLTRFLHIPGVPLDNNICERALKKAILHRKNSLFYKTRHGALVGDMYMSLIYTAYLCGSNPIDYLTELFRHSDEATIHPEQWMPWNYRDTIVRSSGVAPVNSAWAS